MCWMTWRAESAKPYLEHRRAAVREKGRSAVPLGPRQRGQGCQRVEPRCGAHGGAKLQEFPRGVVAQEPPPRLPARRHAGGSLRTSTRPRSEHVQRSGWMLIHIRGGREGDSALVRCLFSIPPCHVSLPGSLQLRRRPQHLRGVVADHLFAFVGALPDPVGRHPGQRVGQLHQKLHLHEGPRALCVPSRRMRVNAIAFINKG